MPCQSLDLLSHNAQLPGSQPLHMAISHGDAAPRCPDIVGNATEEGKEP